MAEKTKTSVAIVFKVWSDIWKHLSLWRKKQIVFLLVLMLFGGLAEAVSLGMVVPFLAAMAEPEKLFHHKLAESLLCALNKTGPQLEMEVQKLQMDRQFLLVAVAFAFMGASIFAGAVRLAVVWASARLAGVVGTDLSVKVYEYTLYQPYSVHLSRNSSHLISGLTTKINLTTISLGALLNLMTSLIIIVFLIGALIVLNPWITLITGGGLGLAYGILTFASHQRLVACSRIISSENNQIVKFLQEGLGGIRDILLDGTQALYARLYQRADTLLRRASANVTILLFSPRYFMETIGIVIFASLAVALMETPSGLATALPILGALALGVQRLLPALHLAYQTWNTMLAYQKSNEEVVDLLNQRLPSWANLPQSAPMLFRNEIRFADVKFCYAKDSSWVLDGLSFIITKGSRVGFVGKTGSGKSTCLDLLMGLLEPTEGKILIDGAPLNHENLRAWQRNIAHVPQAIYLPDSTLAENIAFGIPAEKIEMHRVREAARKAQIADFIESSPKGYQALVGERGVQLSGGQRQRIGIARALYKQAQVLVFDEATSALDAATEEAVMKSIGSLSAELTILIIAHRTSTLKNCTQIIDLGKDKNL